MINLFFKKLSFSRTKNLVQKFSFGLILGVLSCFLIVQTSVNAQEARPGKTLPPDQQSTQVGLPSPSQNSSSTSSVSSPVTSNSSSLPVAPTGQEIPTVPSDYQLGPETVRSGGLSTFVGLFLVLGSVATAYFYWHQKYSKSSLKTKEKKLG